jgi:hypothetical protein
MFTVGVLTEVGGCGRTRGLFKLDVLPRTVWRMEEQHICKYISRLIFNFAPGDQAVRLLGLLGEATRQSSHGKSG